ncbi:hypothetical protein M1563_01315 [Patescibacteria group bacterium]|nr:hypothetical protein [Patescibacteria group bacterium]MCL5410225.1 hypothetical protein [Patescibacteria group bacterium]
MRKFLNYFLALDSFYSLPFAFAVLTVFFIGTIFTLSFKHLPEQIPLFYSTSWGESQLVSKLQFLILPTVVSLISLVNFFVASQLPQNQLVLKRILITSSVFVNIIILVTAIKIMTIYY